MGFGYQYTLIQAKPGDLPNSSQIRTLVGFVQSSEKAQLALFELKVALDDSYVESEPSVLRSMIDCDLLTVLVEKASKHCDEGVLNGALRLLHLLTYKCFTVTKEEGDEQGSVAEMLTYGALSPDASVAKASAAAFVRWVSSHPDDLSSNTVLCAAPALIALPLPQDATLKNALIKKTRICTLLISLVTKDIMFPTLPECIVAAQKWTGEEEIVDPDEDEDIIDLWEEFFEKVNTFLFRTSRMKKLPSLQNSMVEEVYPVGIILFMASETNPNTMFTGTKWVKLSSGYFIQTCETRPTSTGGSSHSGSTALTVSQMPTHSHLVTITNASPTVQTSASGEHRHSIGFDRGTSAKDSTPKLRGSGSNYTMQTDPAGLHSHTVDLSQLSFTATCSTTGLGQGHSHTIDPPHISLIAWQRTE